MRVLMATRERFCKHFDQLILTGGVFYGDVFLVASLIEMVFHIPSANLNFQVYLQV
jgi:hypothetical protein